MNIHLKFKACRLLYVLPGFTLKILVMVYYSGTPVYTTVCIPISRRHSVFQAVDQHLPVCNTDGVLLRVLCFYI